VALWVDPVVHEAECQRFDSHVVRGPGPRDCDFFTAAIGKDGYGRFFIYRGGAGICVRPNRYALARALGVPLQPEQLALHECDHLLCVKVCAPDSWPQHVVEGTQGDFAAWLSLWVSKTRNSVQVGTGVWGRVIETP
jgi:hypothetical protein